MLKLSKFEDALSDFSQVIALQTDHGQAYYARAVTNEKLGLNEQAQRDFITALRLQTESR